MVRKSYGLGAGSYKNSFRELFQDNCDPHQGFPLSLVDPEIAKDQKVARITPNDVTEDILFWQTALVDIFWSVPKMQVVTNFVDS